MEAKKQSFISKRYSELLKKIKPQKKVNPGRFKFLTLGFHGDSYLINIVDFLVKKGVVNFIETGTNVGSTLAYVAKKYPNLECYSCEPDAEAYKQALLNTKNCKNVTIRNVLSQDFISEIANSKKPLFGQKTLLWIDAHGYGFEWPLKEEMEFFTKYFKDFYLFIDDFKVPHLDNFKFDSFKKQVCEHKYIEDSIRISKYHLYYPNYTEKTSPHHSLTGWGLYTNDFDLKFSDEIQAGILPVGK